MKLPRIPNLQYHATNATVEFEFKTRKSIWHFIVGLLGLILLSFMPDDTDETPQPTRE